MLKFPLMGILDEIIEKKKAEIAGQKSKYTLRELKARAEDAPETKSLINSLRRRSDEPIRFIGELKRASPSRGLLRADFDPVDIAIIYRDNSAAAVSVITEKNFFLGSMDYLRQVRHAVDIPVLCKDFILDEYQIYEARASGADAVLLIADILSRTQAEELYSLAGELEMDVLFEVHHWKSLETVLLLNVPLIGINNRDLKTMKIDINTTLSLIKDIPEDRVVVSESGITTREHVRLLERTRVDALLIGTVFMEASDIAEKIESLFGRN